MLIVSLALCSFPGILDAAVPEFATAAWSTEKSISLSFKVEKAEYRKNEGVLIRFVVENKRSGDIFLVVGEPVTPGYEDNRKEIVADIRKIILTYHFFSYPTLKRIKPGQKYHSEVVLRLESVSDKSISAKWLLYLTAGYLSAKEMSEMNQLVKRFGPDGLAKEFDARQEFLHAGPVEININE